MPTPPLSDLLGPSGALILAIFGVTGLIRVIVILWRDHLEADRRDRQQRDRMEDMANRAIEAYHDLGLAWHERDEYDAHRRRIGDD